jgi:hypothetical protein
MKQVTVKSVNGQVQVNINNANDGDELTPKMAKAARNTAFGVAANATVTDGNKKYRVTKSGVRKQRIEW